MSADTWARLNPGADWAQAEDNAATQVQLGEDPSYMRINAAEYWTDLHTEAQRRAQLIQWHADDHATASDHAVDTR